MFLAEKQRHNSGEGGIDKEQHIRGENLSLIRRPFF